MTVRELVTWFNYLPQNAEVLVVVKTLDGTFEERSIKALMYSMSEIELVLKENE